MDATAAAVAQQPQQSQHTGSTLNNSTSTTPPARTATDSPNNKRGANTSAVVAELPASGENNPPGYIARQMSWESGAEAGYRPSSSGGFKQYG